MRRAASVASDAVLATPVRRVGGFSRRTVVDMPAARDITYAELYPAGPG